MIKYVIYILIGYFLYYMGIMLFDSLKKKNDPGGGDINLGSFDMVGMNNMKETFPINISDVEENNESSRLRIEELANKELNSSSDDLDAEIDTQPVLPAREYNPIEEEEENDDRFNRTVENHKGAIEMVNNNSISYRTAKSTDVGTSHKTFYAFDHLQYFPPDDGFEINKADKLTVFSP